MGLKLLALAFGLVVAASPVSASNPEPGTVTAAPAASPNAKYCLRVEAITGTRLESVLCWTREQWAEEGVDVDKEWAKEGVAVIA